MASQIQVFDQMKRASAGLTTKQRILVIGGGVLTLVTLLVFVQLMGKGDYKPLFTGLGRAGRAETVHPISRQGISLARSVLTARFLAFHPTSGRRPSRGCFRGHAP